MREDNNHLWSISLISSSVFVDINFASQGRVLHLIRAQKLGFWIKFRWLLSTSQILQQKLTKQLICLWNVLTDNFLQENFIAPQCAKYCNFTRETVPFQKIPHEEISLNYSILRSASGSVFEVLYTKYVHFFIETCWFEGPVSIYFVNDDCPTSQCWLLHTWRWLLPQKMIGNQKILV